MDRLLLITNLTHEDREEDLHLAACLGKRFDITIASPVTAIPLLAAGMVDGCLIRNAWPGAGFKAAFAAVEHLTALHEVPCYNPFVPGRRGPVENKAYLVELYGAGYPVIPTYSTPMSMVRAGHGLTDTILAKPFDGCSSRGIVATTLQDALHRDPPGGFVYQPRIAFGFEVSLFFIDGQHVWSMRSGGPSMADRWDLVRYHPSVPEVQWAQRFIDWNNLPYGLQRIDAARLEDGTLLLMEMEDSTPFLSLDALDATSRDLVVGTLVESIVEHLGTASRARGRHDRCGGGCVVTKAA